jgi:DtxR family Mn-dependent transcriptional regulator
VSTNAIAEMMDTKASSVTDMLKKLAEKIWNYIKYRGVSLTEQGKLAAKMIVRNTDFGRFSWWKIRFFLG